MLSICQNSTINGLDELKIVELGINIHSSETFLKYGHSTDRFTVPQRALELKSEKGGMG